MYRLILAALASAMVIGASILTISPETSSTPSGASVEILQVGFASREITPEVGKDKPPVYMAGFGQNRIADGVNDPLYAKAVVLRDGPNTIALVTLDIVGFFYPNTLNVRQALPGFTKVIVCSTHNHEGPDTMGLWGPSPVKNGINPEYLKRVENEAVAAVKEAEKNLQPATARFGSAQAPQLLFDSREPYLLHDELYTLKFMDAQNKPIGILVNWHCHPETLADKNTKLSADYVGYCCEALRKKHDCPVAYFTGTVGGLMTTLHLKVRDEQGTLLPENSLAKTIEYGHQLAAVADRAITASQLVKLTPLQYASQVIYLPLANPVYKVGRTLGVLDRDAFQWKGDYLQAGDKLPARNSTGDIALQSE
ncbi:MAG TPA: neutral/alkaline non-lysosomal ceramidase N-terminal domain-containing protein, partial [Gemmatales bacterium]|nr:neutral/alkaline non-lysosomal ceramidase N-terminal domain-containing protein [Gemmatales bacterium]